MNSFEITQEELCEAVQLWANTKFKDPVPSVTQVGRKSGTYDDKVIVFMIVEKEGE